MQLSVQPGVHRYAERCPARKHLAGASHAVGFFTATPPTVTLVRSIAVTQTVRAGVVVIVVRSGPLPGVTAIVQVEMNCA